MKKYLIAVLFLLIITGFAQSQTVSAINALNAGKNKSFQEETELIFEHLKNFPNKTEVSVAFIKNSEVSFFGAIRKNDTLFSTNNYNNIFEIGSITKVFTATLLSGFILDEKVNADDNINDYIDFPINNNIQLTFEQLANHTSGLPRMPLNFNKAAMLNPANPYKNFNEELLKEYLTEYLTLAYPPGEKMEYSNLGAGLLGYTLTKISGSGFQELMNKRIFSKYGMENSTTNRKKLTRRLVPPLNANGEITSNWDFLVLAGAGGILSTAKDLSKFALAQFDRSKEELAMTKRTTYKASVNLHLGLGWHIILPKAGTEWHWHNGATGGYTSSLALDICKKNGIIILSNVSAFNADSGKIDDLCFSLLENLQ